jgi:uncharacterized repeat protein (TIGR01451 family)
LAPLANNGGLTQTFALLPGSPALDAGNSELAGGNTDQRGFLRQAGANIDIGAYEYQYDLMVSAAAPASVLPGGTIAYNFSVTNNGPDAVPAATLTDVLPAGTTFVSFTVFESANVGVPHVGQAGTVTATLPLNAGDSATFTLVVQVPPTTLGTITNSATFSPADDITPANNTAVSHTTVPLAAAALQFSQQPASAMAGQTLAPVQVTIFNQLGQVFSSDNTDHVTLTGATFTGGSTTTVRVVNGVATFSNLVINQAGPYTLRATSGNLAAAVSSSFTVAPTTTSQLLVSGFPVSATAGVAGTLTVTAVDRFGNRTPGYTGTVHFTSSDARAVLPADVSLTNAVGSFAITLETAGTQSLGATDTVTVTITGRETGIRVAPAAPASLLFLTQPSSVVAGQPITPAVRVELLDAFGNVATNSTASVTVALANNPGAATLGGTTTVNAVGGVATFNNLSLTTAGTGYTLLASRGMLPAATSNAFNVTAAAPAGVDIRGQPGDTVVGRAISPAVKVVVVDAFGNTVTTSSAAVTLVIASGPAGAILGGTTTVPAFHGVATFSNLTLNLPGTYTLQATGGTLAPDTSNSFTVAAGALPPAVTLQRGKLRRLGNQDSGRFEQLITITNTSGRTLSGPLVFKVDGLPQGITYQGSAAIDVPRIRGGLAPGQSARMILKFFVHHSHREWDADQYGIAVIEER